MTVEVAGSMTPSMNEASLQRSQGKAPTTKVIDETQIKSILYLGIRGEIKLPFEQGRARAVAVHTAGGVDTFA